MDYEKSKWRRKIKMEHLIVIILFLGAFCFPHCEALARPQNGDSHSSRYDNSAIRRTNREAGAKGNCRREEEKKKNKKRILEAESSRTFYIESVSLVNGKGDEFVGNRLYIREKFRALDAPFRNQLNRVIPL